MFPLEACMKQFGYGSFSTCGKVNLRSGSSSHLFFVALILTKQHDSLDMQVQQLTLLPTSQIHPTSGLPLAREAGICAQELCILIRNLLILCTSENPHLVRDCTTCQMVVNSEPAPSSPSVALSAPQGSLKPARKELIQQMCSPECQDLLSVSLASAIAHNRQQQELVWKAPCSSSSTGRKPNTQKVAAEGLKVSMPLWHSSYLIYVVPEVMWTSTEANHRTPATHWLLDTLQLLLKGAALVKKEAKLSVGKAPGDRHCSKIRSASMKCMHA